MHKHSTSPCSLVTRTGTQPIDLTLEQPLPLSDVPKLDWIPLRRGGRRLHVATVHRWCTRGIRGVKLAFVQLGGTRVTTIEALLRFFNALTATEGPQSDQVQERRLKEETETERTLIDLGC
jgi:Protein of unknown function (DUF1580)